MRQLNLKLKDFRESKGWSKTYMANKLGVSSQLYGQYERDNDPKTPGGEFFVKWKKEFGFDLLDGETKVSNVETESHPLSPMYTIADSNKILADAARQGQQNVAEMVQMLKEEREAYRKMQANLNELLQNQYAIAAANTEYQKYVIETFWKLQGKKVSGSDTLSEIHQKAFERFVEMQQQGIRLV